MFNDIKSNNNIIFTVNFFKVSEIFMAFVPELIMASCGKFNTCSETTPCLCQVKHCSCIAPDIQYTFTFIKSIR